ncbi:unnamed protein product, partial [Polarella glacialis]
ITYSSSLSSSPMSLAAATSSVAAAAAFLAFPASSGGASASSSSFGPSVELLRGFQEPYDLAMGPTTSAHTAVSEAFISAEPADDQAEPLWSPGGPDHCPTPRPAGEDPWASILGGMVDNGSRWSSFCEQHEAKLTLLAAAAAMGVRCATTIFPYSGEGKPPMFGDFEAQRHWMEVTTALPALQWYEHSADNNLLYWGLDYPPLTAYHSWIFGKLGHSFVPECFQLLSSRGHESQQCRLFMRSSVLASDLLVYLPGALCAVWGFASPKEAASVRLLAVVLLWLLPPLVIIDHGHFQFNGVCFGLCLAAAGCVARGRTLLASVLFTSGLLFKQIALYYAPAFFVGILAHCVARSPQGWLRALGRVAVTGVVVLATVLAAFWPWAVLSGSPVASVGQVLHRMFPFGRGLYEDKVANFWCSISVVVKLHRLLPAHRVPLACAVATLLALAPACGCCLRPSELKALSDRSPVGGGAFAFAAALFVSSMSFFLFAFQVHEKSVLFPCVASCLLPLALGPERRPSWAAAALCHFLLACLFSMYPLMVKDGLEVPYGVGCTLCALLCEASSAPGVLRLFYRLSFVFGVVLHLVHAFLPPPGRYPDAWTLLITGSCCAYFLSCLVAVTAAQLRGVFDGSGVVATAAASDPRHKQE